MASMLRVCEIYSQIMDIILVKIIVMPDISDFFVGLDYEGYSQIIIFHGMAASVF